MIEPKDADPVRKEAFKKLKDIQKGLAQEFMSDEKLDELFKKGEDYLEECMHDDGDFNMMVFLYGRGYDPTKDDWELMPVMFADWPPPETIGGMNGKQVTMMGIGAKFAEQFPKHMLMCAVHMSEAWMAEVPKDQIEEDKHLAPSQYSTRVECAIVQATALDQRTRFSTREIKRDKDGKFEALVEYKPGGRSKKRMKNDDQFEVEDYLTRHIFMGYFMARGKGDKSGSKTTT